MAKLNEYCILNTVRFPGMNDRQDGITKPSAETLDWIFQESPDNLPTDADQVAFSTWLMSGQGVFNITGKPGSGKSTLMKHLVTTRIPMSAGKQLLVVRSYLWLLGQSSHQRSYTGLVRYILHELLEQAPHLIQQAFQSIGRVDWNVHTQKEDWISLQRSLKDFDGLAGTICEWATFAQICVFSREDRPL
ncbi:hypothetical protein QBC38DRAFT_453859 [Podospora fimiseda]|uniref:Nephrocystin 3-like N-terminal domain-containing protein n=1 Tax=Podospora fimiseda TaxID=252190 RepID=A0AAN7H125_9PEZI|nr:hypothetical protein QBC38DRAFT_453859 [Podospora fimiseda]